MVGGVEAGLFVGISVGIWLDGWLDGENGDLTNGLFVASEDVGIREGYMLGTGVGFKLGFLVKGLPGT